MENISDDPGAGFSRSWLGSLLRYYGLSLLTLILVLVYFINSGIDLNDEGFYLQGYGRGQDLFFSTTGFHFIVRALPFSDDVFVNRLYRIFFHIFVSWFLSSALVRFFGIESGRREIFYWALLGNLASFVYAPYSLSYNTVNLFLLQISIGLFLMMRVKDRDGSAFAYHLLLLIAVVALIVFNKASSGVLLSFVLALYYVLFFNGSYGQKLIKSLLAGLLVIGLSSLFFYAAFGNNIFTYLDMLSRDETGVVSNQKGILFHLKQLFFNPVYQSKKQLVFVAALVVTYLFDSKRRKVAGLSMGFEIVSVFVLLVVFAYYYRYYPYGSGAEIFTIPLLFLVFVAWRGNWMILQRKDHLTFITLLFITPFVGFFGSDVAPFEGLNHYAVFFFVLLYLLNITGNFLFIRLYYFIFTVFIMIRFICFPFENPPLYTLKDRIGIRGNIFSLSVNKDVSLKYHVFNDFMDKAGVESEPAVFINVSPGLLYMSGYRNYLTVYYNNGPGLGSYLSLVNALNKSDSLDYIVNLSGFAPDKKLVFSSFVNTKTLSGYSIDTILVDESWLHFRFRKQVIVPS